MKGRPLVITWTETAQELADRLAQEHEPLRRVRLQALLMLRNGARISDASDATGVKYRTVQRWLSWYRIGGLEEVLRRTPGYNAVGRGSQLTPAQTAALLRAQEAGHMRTIHDAVAWTLEHYGVALTYSGMHAHLQRARKRATAK